MSGCPSCGRSEHCGCSLCADHQSCDRDLAAERTAREAAETALNALRCITSRPGHLLQRAEAAERRLAESQDQLKDAGFKLTNLMLDEKKRADTAERRVAELEARETHSLNRTAVRVVTELEQRADAAKRACAAMRGALEHAVAATRMPSRGTHWHQEMITALLSTDGIGWASPSEVAALVKERDEARGLVARLREALEFYADPDTYVAIGIFPDPPCGAFMDDFEVEDEHHGPRPGRRARAALSSSPDPAWTSPEKVSEKVSEKARALETVARCARILMGMVYPPDVFTGNSGDLGAAAHNLNEAIAACNEYDS